MVKLNESHIKRMKKGERLPSIYDQGMFLKFLKDGEKLNGDLYIEGRHLKHSKLQKGWYLTNDLSNAVYIFSKFITIIESEEDVW